MTLTKFFYFLIGTILTFSLYATCPDYPHWKTCTPTLVHIDDYLVNHSPLVTHHRQVAAFDWDGTLFSEQIALHDLPQPYTQLNGITFAGQPAWMIFSAIYHHGFPAFKANYPALVNQVLYTENKTLVPVDGYSKYSQAAKYTVGMTPGSLRRSVDRFLQAYPAENNAFFRVLDILQRAHQLGYQTWIITGSNPYYVAEVIRHLQRHYHLNLGVLNANPPTIAGNMARLSAQGKFTLVYDDHFTKNAYQPTVHYNRDIVDGHGKTLVIQNTIEPHEKAHVALYVGNSGGDYDAMHFLLARHQQQPKKFPLLAIAIHPNGESSFASLDQLAHQYPNVQEIEITKKIR